MSHNLVEASTFDPNVTVPDPADARTAASVEVPFQAITNRTKYLKDRTDPLLSQLATYSVGVAAAPKNTGDKFELVQIATTAGLSVAANEITAAAAGQYEVLACLTLFSIDATDPLAHQVSIDVNGAASFTAKAVRYKNAAGDLGTQLVVHRVLGLTAGQKISLTNRGAIGASIDPANSGLTVKRLY